MVAVVVAVAGLAKLRDPLPARRLLYGLGLRVPASAVRSVGVGELCLGAAAIAVGGRVSAALLAATYLGFSVIGVTGIRAAAGEGCGCFGGRSDAPLGPEHLATTALSAAVAVGAAFNPVPGVGELRDDGWLHLVAHLGVVAVGAALLVVVYTDAAANGAAMRQARAQRARRAEAGT